MAEIINRRKQTFVNASWLYDIKTRQLLNMNPPYQRWSVWTRRFQEDFIDTIFLGFPSPAIFLYRQVEGSGRTTYDVVDGKQRLTAIFEFIEGVYPVRESSALTNLRGKSFTELPEEYKLAFWDYDFAIEYLPTNNVAVVNEIFERLNKNTARLTQQELRHAKFGGDFITAAERLATWTWGGVGGENPAVDRGVAAKLPSDLPRISDQSRRQMKDVEIVATLLLFLEEGVRGYTVDALDDAFAKREEWVNRTRIEDEYRLVIETLASLWRHIDGFFITQSRLRNQTDFYSLFGATAELLRENKLPPPEQSLARLKVFLALVDEHDASGRLPEHVGSYYEAARSASNDVGARQTRISIVKRVLTGTVGDNGTQP